MPVVAIAGQQVVGCLRAVLARCVGGDAATLAPGIEERLHRAPAVLDVVGPLEQGLVADQAVVDQGFIAGGRLHLEEVLVGETQLDVL